MEMYKVLFNTMRTNPRIYIVDVDKFTASSIFIDGHRRARLSQHRCYFTTENDAKLFILKRIKTSIDNCQDKLDKLMQEFEYVNNLIPIKEE